MNKIMIISQIKNNFYVIFILLWEDNIKMDLRKTGQEGVGWMHLTQDMDQWQDFVNMAMNLRFPYMVGNFLTE
jgi:hypothetical protein